MQEDEHRRDLRLERRVAGDQHERADLADGTGEGERDPGEDPGEDIRQHDAPEDAELARAQRARCFFRIAVELEQHRLDGADDEGERHEEQREQDRLARQRDVDPHG